VAAELGTEGDAGDAEASGGREEDPPAPVRRVATDSLLRLAVDMQPVRLYLTK